MSDEDFIAKTFDDLYYPGSKKKRKSPTVKTTAVAEESLWDARPYKKTLPNGREVEFFTIGALAQALGRPIITLKDWMKKGYIPLPPYRLPAKVDKIGRTQAGRRLYTRAMIEVAIKIFSDAGILNASRIEWSAQKKVTAALALEWSKIKEEEMKQINGRE